MALLFLLPASKIGFAQAKLEALTTRVHRYAALNFRLQFIVLHAIDVPGAPTWLHREAGLLCVDGKDGELRFGQSTCNKR